MDRPIFEHACVINLNARTDRWARMQTNLSAAGIEAERFSAISIADLKDCPPPLALRDFLLRVDGESARFEHKLQATWACMQSHLAIIRLAKEADWSSVLILEDDCEFEPYTHPVLQRAISQLKKIEWDIFFLGGTLKKGSVRRKISSNLMSVSRVRLAHAYMVNASVYDRILDEAPTSGLPIDWYYSEILLPSTRALMVRPLLARQRTMEMSDIEQTKRKPKVKTRLALERWLAKLRYSFFLSRNRKS